MRTPEDTAILLTLLLKRSGQNRARISSNTIRRLAKRTHIRAAFVQVLMQRLDEIGLILIELDRGGYGLIRSRALDGAPTITAKKYLVEDLKKLKQGKLNISDIRAEVEEEIGIDEQDDE